MQASSRGSGTDRPSSSMGAGKGGQASSPKGVRLPARHAPRPLRARLWLGAKRHFCRVRAPVTPVAHLWRTPPSAIASLGAMGPKQEKQKGRQRRRSRRKKACSPSRKRKKACSQRRQSNQHRARVPRRPCRLCRRSTCCGVPRGATVTMASSIGSPFRQRVTLTGCSMGGCDLVIGDRRADTITHGTSMRARTHAHTKTRTRSSHMLANSLDSNPAIRTRINSTSIHDVIS